ncbi:MAG: dUTPase [Clostridia bacterium]|nr:dUTPase [Clostridia bacterium]
MDKLDRIFALQAELDAKIEKEHDIHFTRDEWVQKEMLAIISELSEALMETNFKWWKNPKETDDEKLHEELIDVLHFFVSLCLRCGLDAEKLYEVYVSKNEENIKRQKGLSEKGGYCSEENKN